MREYNRANRLDYLTDLKNTYGDVVRMRYGPFPLYMLYHPDDVHEVLVKQAAKFYKPRLTKSVFNRFLGNGLIVSDGDFWKRQRKLAQPAFHARRIESYAQVMVDYAQRMLDGWQDGQTRDIDQEMMKLTMSIVARTLFDADVSGDAEAVGRAMTVIQQIANQQFNSVIPPLPEWIPTTQNRRERQAVEALDRVLARIVNERRASGEDTGDLLSMLLLAEDENGERMTDQQVRDEAMTLFLAGHETTSNALTWTWYLLSQHPEIETKLHDELTIVLGGRAPTLNDLPQLKYTEMVVKESMRLYPPAWGISREPLEDVEIGGYTLEKGKPVFIVPYVQHRDSRWFDEPERFLPERWEEGFEERLPRYAYMPFGGGPRVCIGNSFAMMEARLLLATIAQHVRLSLRPGYKVEPEPMITLRVKGGLPMTLHARSKVDSTRREAETATSI
jgi:cytochrome P450